MNQKTPSNHPEMRTGWNIKTKRKLLAIYDKSFINDRLKNKSKKIDLDSSKRNAVTRKISFFNRL